MKIKNVVQVYFRGNLKHMSKLLAMVSFAATLSLMYHLQWKLIALVKLILQKQSGLVLRLLNFASTNMKKVVQFLLGTLAKIK